MRGTALAAALDVLAGLVIEDGRRWGDAAVEDQWTDARAVLDPNGAEPYHYLTRARGYSKTADLAGVAIAVMLAQLPDASRLYALAADKDQGRLLVDSIRGYAARTPGLSGALTVDNYQVTATRSATALEVIAADAPSAYGLRPAFLIVDELAQWASTPAPRLLWEATTSAMVKVAGARLVVLTSAGDPAHWSHRVLEHAKGDPLWHVHEIDGPPPWADPARLAEQRRRLPASSYARLFLNRWTAAEDRLTNLDDLRACVTLTGPLAPKAGRSYVVGVDLGIKRDRTVAAVCHAEPTLRPREGENAIGNDETGTTIVLDRMELWQGSSEHPVQLDAVEEWVAQAARTYYPARVIFDPWQAVGMTQRLSGRGVQVEEFTFSQASVGKLASTLHLLLRNRALALPNDVDLLDELANVRLRETSPGVVRMDHDADRHDDRAVALGLASMHLLSSPGSKAISFLMALAPPCVRCDYPNERGSVECGRCGAPITARSEANRVPALDVATHVPLTGGWRP